MSRFSIAIIAILAAFTIIPGCCNGVPENIVRAGESLPNPNDFVKSVVMVSVKGIATAKIGKEVKSKEVSISASAVAIDKKHLLTAAHFCGPVLQGWSDEGMVDGIITVRFDKNMKMTYLNNNEENATMDGVNIVTLDKEKDICLLEKKGHGIIPAKIAAPATIHRGDKVYIIGAPLGVFPVKTEGEVAVVSLQFEEKEAVHINGRILVTAAATNGNSGGPCMNTKGEIIGILMAGAEGYDHLSILTPSRMILSFLRKNHRD